MKILLISMSSIHAIRWIENLKDTSYELYWFDVIGKGKLETLDSVHQFTDWKKRKIPHIKGEFFLSKKTPFLYEKILPFVEVTANEELEKIILEIQPDIVHSFEMQNCSYPILKTMQKYPKIKWLYSCWGNDLYYFQQFSSHLKKIKQVLQRVDFLHTDCQRDFILAKKHGFSGIHSGVVPGGTGYKLDELQSYKIPISERRIILVKGYEHILGRGLNIIKALNTIQDRIQDYEVVVFGAHNEVIEYIKSNQLNFKVYDRHELSHHELMQLMGKSLFYIGNSISDGMPNTLLEAIVMGAFPIQSNPGGATEEIITNGINGFLIENPESVSEIKTLILHAISDFQMVEKAAIENENIVMQRLDYSSNRIKVIDIYKNILECE
ncbi:glycosyl transferase family 4 [Flavobacterium sp. 90]|uniref:glycosyltransferase family 4 protein n=1 Tax=unclassified Flavobacterium TaxID=196869 RepID=UPI000EB1D02A|nr:MULTISPECIES: glycosyltransferase family 4 protein [unclassified Flavobacterium]RKR10940.1 glycosyl transferase family 4 [Flavobacterium sp. 81]TCK54724.1 glycosyl transferase family 4 [Flavobacterium sp. 90]